MMKEVVRALDAGILPEIGLIAFFVAFLLIVARVLTMKKKERDTLKQIPLDDDEVLTPRSSDQSTSYDHAE